MGKENGGALNSGFYKTLPSIREVPIRESDMAWFVYGLVFDPAVNAYTMTQEQTMYTKFDDALDSLTRSEAGSVDTFVQVLQAKLDGKISNPPVAPILAEDQC